MKLYPDAALTYVNESGRVRTKASRATTLQHLRHLQACHPRADLAAFTHEHLHAFCLLARPDGNPPAAGTVKSRRGQLVSFFEWATFTGLVETNPAAKLKYSVRPANTFVRSHTWLSEAQLVRLVQSFPSTVTGRRDRVVCMILAFTGLRVFEVAALRWDQFSADLAKWVRPDKVDGSYLGTEKEPTWNWREPVAL